MNWKKLLQIGTSVAASVTGIGALAMIPDLVNTVEKLFFGKPGQGETKKAIVMEMILYSMTVSEGVSRRDLLDNEKFMDAMDKAIDAIVEMNNAIYWKKAQPSG